MYFLIALVIILVVFTYAISPEKTGMQGRKSQRSNNPFQGRFKERSGQGRPHTTIDKGSLMRCHNCACFFPPTRVVNAVVEGHVLEFCSENCRNHFLAPQ